MTNLKSTTMGKSNENNKRLHTDTDSDTSKPTKSTPTQSGTSFPRFIVVESTEPSKKIASISPFIIEK